MQIELLKIILSMLRIKKIFKNSMKANMELQKKEKNNATLYLKEMRLKLILRII